MKRFHASVEMTCCLLPLGAGESERTVTIEPGQTTGYIVSLRQYVAVFGAGLGAVGGNARP